MSAVAKSDVVFDNTSTLNSGFAFDSLESVRKKLLDLSGRNTLLNYKHPKTSCIRLIDELPDQIISELRDDKTLTFIPVPEPTEKELIETGYIEADPKTGANVDKGYPSAEQWAKHLGFAIEYDLPDKTVTGLGKQHHQDSDLQTLMYAPELEARLRSLRNKAETALEESGANILYLGVGFLEWVESKDSDVKRMAPLFTLPVKLERSKHTGNEGVYRYSITMKDDGLLTNVTLKEKLANDFDLILPAIEDETTPEMYFDKVQYNIIRNQSRWKLRRQASLVLLNFSKQAMYQDLDPDNWPKGAGIQDHPLIAKFFSSVGHDIDSDGVGYATEHPIDHIEGIHDNFPLVFDADSSQHSALIDALKGENLVIEGPPGSGKSQTIANLIAASIANGKRVLFVAEKMAALNVVKDRLDRAGLGDFCLELHSHKTNKQKILNDLSIRLDKQGAYRAPKDIKADIERFEDLKGKLHEYVELINSHWAKTGLTFHEIFNKATRYREQLGVNPDTLKIVGINGENLTLLKQKELFDHSDMLKHIYEQVSEQALNGEITNHYWYGVTNTELMGFQSEELAENLTAWTRELESLNLYWAHINNTFELGIEGDSQLENIWRVSRCIGRLPKLVGGEVFDQLTSLSGKLELFEKWLDHYEEIHRCNDELSSVIKPQAITEAETFTTLMTALKFLGDLGVSESVTLDELAISLTEVKKTMEDLDEIERKFSKIAPSLPPALMGCFSTSKQSLDEFNVLTQIISKLPDELWRFRDDTYDNPDLDPLLEQMTKKLGVLTPLHKTLHEYFSLHRLPDPEVLKHQQAIINDGGLFKWLSSSWRKARKEVLSLSALPKPDARVLISLLPELIQYADGVLDMDELNKEDNVLQDIYRGVDTPIERAVILRNWYKTVRAEYGVGFGDRVAMGSALLNLDRALIVGISDYANQGLGQLVTKVICASSSYISTYSSFIPLRDKKSELGRQLSILSHVISTQLASLEIVVSGPGHSLNLLVDVSSDLERQCNRITEWNSMPITDDLVRNKALPLSVKAGEFSENLLGAGRNTLSIAEILAESPEVLHGLSVKPGIERYLAITDCLYQLKEHESNCEETCRKFTEKGFVKIDEWMASSYGAISALIDRNCMAIDNPNWLNTWLDYIRLRTRLCEQGLNNIIGQLEEKSISICDLNNVVQLVVHHQLSNEILENHKSLALFSGMEQVANQAKFQEYDRKLMFLQRELVAYKASRLNAPSGISTGKVGSYTELSLIRHNMNLKKPRVAVRSLIKRAAKSMQILKPCFMMSPMSVAQYLEPGQFEFDLVVMDEASQIRPEDALGAIARGKSLVVVGDPKQLPPTSFFQKVVNNEDSDDVVALEESESILESVSPMFKNRRLRWHYRSRHESLIAFSNHRFYDSNLILFPSPIKESDEFGIRFSRVSKGRFVNRRNVEEAKIVVRSAANQMIEKPKESVGIVAMNSEQKDEIERQLEQLVKDEPLLQQAYERNQALDEPLFIKNLENVQGDERDIIIISMTYGPETVGAPSMHQRFGPINSNVGWRRLNVLFTRSKKRMHICSSMDSGHIRTSDNSSRGVVALKAFLEYCETGLLQHYSHTGKAADSDFEIAVMNVLSEHGYSCEPQLGVTGYFLDLAVKDPGMPGRFLMGIECDGASYHSAKSTRDRDRLRQDILESLGWKIRRIWSTDWFKNPQAQIQPILRELDQLRTAVPEVVDPIEKLAVDVRGQVTAVEAGNTDNPDGEDDVLECDLRARLVAYNNKVIISKLPDIDERSRLLRPAMLEALLNFKPCSKADFLESIPAYLRHGTAAAEGEYLDSVLELIADYG